MDCIFCKIDKGEIPSTKIYEDDHVFAIPDIAPKAPVHALIIPKKHIPSLIETAEEDLHLFTHIHRAAQEVARIEGVAESGFRVVNNCGKDGAQEVLHIHYHLLGGKPLGHIVP